MEPSRASDEPAAASFPELLNFCSRAQTLIAELLLLSDRIPSQFLDSCFQSVLFDLRYFDSPSDYESKIDGNAELETLDDELHESCSSYTQRFFTFANGVVVYHKELLKYLTDLQEGLYVQYALDGVLESKHGTQLLTESIALFGSLLLLLEHRLGGPIREKLLVSYLRKNQTFNSPNLDRIFSLCRVHNPNASKPTSDFLINIQKTEDLFARFPFPKPVVDSIIMSCIRGEDMCDRIRVYPDSNHKTLALSLQAGYLYVILFYSTGFLNNGNFMREIVDRFFKDNWVISVFLYFSVDLFVSWDLYKEAKLSLISCVTPNFIRDQCIHHCTKAKELISEVDSTISNSALSRDYVLENSQNLISLIRNCNFSLHWILLQRMSHDKKARDVLSNVFQAQQVDEHILFLLLLKISKVEFEVQELYNQLLAERESMWSEKKKFTLECLNDLCHNRLGTSWASALKLKNKSLNDWFNNLSSEVNLLEYKGCGSSSRAIYRIISSLKEIEQLHQIQESTQIKHEISKIQKGLHDLVKILSLDNETINVLNVITDAVYAWGYLGKFEELLKDQIKKNPSILMLLHALFLKFRSLLSVPVSRINDHHSPDLPFVTKYYSSKYASKILSVLEIIPVILLDISFDEDCLDQPLLQTNRIDKERVEDFMQLDRQLHLARQASKLSIISEAIDIISKIFNGLINLNLKAWVEQKMREEITNRLKSKLKSFFIYPHIGRIDLENNLSLLLSYISSQSQTMELLQDAIHIQGNRVWDETFALVLEQSAIEEQADLIGQKNSAPQINICSKPQTFLGILLQKMIELTDPSQSMFIEPMLRWFDAEGNELLGLHFFNLLESCIGQFGLTSLDSLLATLINLNLEHTLNTLNTLLDSRYLEDLHRIDEILGSPVSIPLLGWPTYNHFIKKYSSEWDRSIKKFATIGQLQLLRFLFTFKLEYTSKAKEKEDSTVKQSLNALNAERNLCGLFSPIETVYISKDAPNFLSRFTSILSISQLSRYVLDVHLGTLTSRSKKSITDFSPLIIGLGTFLSQFHHLHTTEYIQYMVQYIRTVQSSFVAVEGPNKGSTNDLPSEVLRAIFWVRSFCKYMKISEDFVESSLPCSVMAILQT